MIKNILLIGEVCVDKYVYTEHTRQSPEDANVPVLKVKSTSRTEGMAAIVSSVLTNLNSPHTLYTLPASITKTRIFKGAEQICRIDEDTHQDGDLLVSNIKKELSKVDTVLVSDYGKGLLSPLIIGNLNNSKKRIYLDPHPNNWVGQYSNVYCLKLNKDEMYKFTMATSLHEGARKLRELCGARHVFITLGSEGMFYQDDKDNTFHSESKVNVVNNVAGAGDVVMASIVHDMERSLAIPEVMSNAMTLVASHIEKPL